MKQSADSNGNVNNWWLRSRHSNNSNNAFYVNNNGDWNNNNVNNNNGVAPGFNHVPITHTPILEARNDRIEGADCILPPGMGLYRVWYFYVKENYV